MGDVENGGQVSQHTEISTVEQTVKRSETPATTPGASQTSVHSPPPRGPVKLDTGYITTLPALIKIAELVVALICIGCVGSGGVYITGAHGFFIFVVVACFILTLGFFIAFVLGLVDWINLPWEFIEMMYGVGASLLLLISSITIACFTYSFPVFIVGAVFGFIDMVLYIFGTFWSFQEWRSAGEAAAH